MILQIFALKKFSLLKYQFYTHFFIAFFSLNHILGTRFTTDDFANFCSKKFFITKLLFLLLHRGVQKWSFAEYCPHFSFITLVIRRFEIRKKIGQTRFDLMSPTTIINSFLPDFWKCHHYVSILDSALCV